MTIDVANPRGGAGEVRGELTASAELIGALEGILVLDFSKFLVVPFAGMRLAILGFRVIKIERARGGDIGQTPAFSGRTDDGTISFHAMNRNEEGIFAGL